MCLTDVRQPAFFPPAAITVLQFTSWKHKCSGPDCTALHHLESFTPMQRTCIKAEWCHASRASCAQVKMTTQVARHGWLVLSYRIWSTYFDCELDLLFLLSNFDQIAQVWFGWNLVKITFAVHHVVWILPWFTHVYPFQNLVTWKYICASLIDW